MQCGMAHVMPSAPNYTHEHQACAPSASTPRMRCYASACSNTRRRPTPFRAHRENLSPSLSRGPGSTRDNDEARCPATRGPRSLLSLGGNGLKMTTPHKATSRLVGAKLSAGEPLFQSTPHLHADQGRGAHLARHRVRSLADGKAKTERFGKGRGPHCETRRPARDRGNEEPHRRLASATRGGAGGAQGQNSGERSVLDECRLMSYDAPLRSLRVCVCDATTRAGSVCVREPSMEGPVEQPPADRSRCAFALPVRIYTQVCTHSPNMPLAQNASDCPVVRCVNGALLTAYGGPPISGATTRGMMRASGAEAPWRRPTP